jgi:hypothetical protein
LRRHRLATEKGKLRSANQGGSEMKRVFLAAIAVSAFIGPAFAQNSIPMDQPITIGGVDTVCTGIGSEAQQDPRWQAYPVRIEFSNGGSQYLSGAHVELSAAGGKQLAALDCLGPWVLFKLPKGQYKVTATLTDQPGGGTSSASFSPPASGQKRVSLIFKIPANH